MRDTAGSGGEGVRGPGDLGFAPTKAERRSNPPLATKLAVYLVYAAYFLIS